MRKPLRLSVWKAALFIPMLLALPAASAVEPAINVAIGSPGAVAIDVRGNVYFSSPSLVYKLDGHGVLARVAGSTVSGYGGDGGPAIEALLNFPATYPELENDPIDFEQFVGGLAADRDGNLYIADAYNGRVRKIDAQGIITSVTTVGPSVTTVGPGPTAGWNFGWPQGVGLDESGNLYVSNQWGDLFKVTPEGVRSKLTGSNCGAGHNGPGLCVPEQIAVDATGNVYVGDGYCRVRKIAPDMTVTTVAGDARPSPYFTFTCGYSGDGGPATSAALGSLPFGVAVDAGGALYIADTRNSCIRKVGSDGIISTIAGACVQSGFEGDGGPATAARLSLPRGVAIDPAGNLYIADTGNNRIRKVAPDGTITTIAGNGSPVATVLAGLPPAYAIGPALSGAWYDPTQSGHGLFIQVLADNRMLAAWFAFDPAGTQQAWFLGVGTYSGDTATITAMDMPTGGRWIPNFNPNQIVHNPWGTLTLTFTDCDHGRVDFSSALGYGAGTMNLTRLTQPAALTCP